MLILYNYAKELAIQVAREHQRFKMSILNKFKFLLIPIISVGINAMEVQIDTKLSVNEFILLNENEQDNYIARLPSQDAFIEFYKELTELSRSIKEDKFIYSSKIKDIERLNLKITSLKEQIQEFKDLIINEQIKLDQIRNQSDIDNEEKANFIKHFLDSIDSLEGKIIKQTNYIMLIQDEITLITNDAKLLQSQHDTSHQIEKMKKRILRLGREFFRK